MRNHWLAGLLLLGVGGVVPSSWATSPGQGHKGTIVVKAAVVAELTGEAQILHKGKDAFEKLELGAKIEAGSIVRVGDGGRCSVRFLDGSLLDIQARAQVKIASELSASGCEVLFGRVAVTANGNVQLLGEGGAVGIDGQAFKVSLRETASADIKTALEASAKAKIDAEIVARLIDVKGRVDILIGGRRTDCPADGSAVAVSVGALVRVGKNGHATLLFPDGSLVKLGAGASVHLAAKSSLTILSGEAQAALSANADERLQIRTAAAAALVVGKQFTLEAAVKAKARVTAGGSAPVVGALGVLPGAIGLKAGAGVELGGGNGGGGCSNCGSGSDGDALKAQINAEVNAQLGAESVQASAAAQTKATALQNGGTAIVDGQVKVDAQASATDLLGGSQSGGLPVAPALPSLPTLQPPALP